MLDGFGKDNPPVRKKIGGSGHTIVVVHEGIRKGGNIAQTRNWRLGINRILLPVEIMLRLNEVRHESNATIQT